MVKFIFCLFEIKVIYVDICLIVFDTKMNTDISQEQLMNTFQYYPEHHDGQPFYRDVFPYVHELFSNALDFVHNMVFNIKPLHSQPNEQGMFEPIFKNPLPGRWRNSRWSMEYLIYLDIGCCSERTKRIVLSEDERQACLVITYDKSSQEVTVKLLKLISNEYTSIQYLFLGEEPIYEDRLYVFNKKDDFLSTGQMDAFGLL